MHSVLKMTLLCQKEKKSYSYDYIRQRWLSMNQKCNFFTKLCSPCAKAIWLVYKGYKIIGNTFIIVNTKNKVFS